MMIKYYAISTSVDVCGRLVQPNFEGWRFQEAFIQADLQLKKISIEKLLIDK
jgi:hypothetical protein